MQKQTVLDFYDGNVRAVAEALNVSTQYVGQWRKRVPEVVAARLDKLTDGQLPYKLEDYTER